MLILSPISRTFDNFRENQIFPSHVSTRTAEAWGGRNVPNGTALKGANAFAPRCLGFGGIVPQ